MENPRATERSTCLNPKPEMSFRPSVPCLMGEGERNALGLSILPPGAFAAGIHNRWPATRSGRGCTLKPGSGLSTKLIPLKGNPLLAKITASTDQFLVARAKGPDLTAEGMSYVMAPEKLWRTSKSEDP